MKIKVLLVLLSILLLPGCSKKEEVIKPYYKATDNYVVTKSNIDNKVLTFEYIKNSIFEVSKKNGAVEIYNPDNLSKIIIYLYHEYSSSNVVSMDKNDFYSESYQDYEKINVGNRDGWSVYYKSGSITNYEASLTLSDEDSDKKVYAAYIKVLQSPIQSDTMDFNTKEFVEGEDFQHLLNSIKLESKLEEDN